MNIDNWISVDASRGFSGITICGDTYFGEWHVSHNKTKNKSHALATHGYGHSFEKVANLLSDIDHNIVNFEGVLTESIISPFPDIKYTLHANPNETIRELKSRNIKSVMVANNHSLDFGALSGMKQKEFFENNSINTIGFGNSPSEANKPLCLECAGKKVLIFAGYWYRRSRAEKYNWYASHSNAGTACLNEHFFSTVSEYRVKYPDAFIVMSPHWGSAFKDTSKHQRALAEKAIMSGVDCIIGHGPHVVSDYEIINNKFVIYSLGNFVFNHNGDLFVSSGKPKYGYVSKLFVSGDSISLRLYPIFIFNPECNFQPYPVSREQLNDLLNHHPVSLDSIESDEHGFYRAIDLTIAPNSVEANYAVSLPAPTFAKESFFNSATDFCAYCMFLEKISNAYDIHIFISGLTAISKVFDVSQLEKIRNKQGKGLSYLTKEQGINIVVYDSKKNVLVDSVRFDILKGQVWRNKKLVLSSMPYSEDTHYPQLFNTINEIASICKQGNNILHKNAIALIEKGVDASQHKNLKLFHKSIPKAEGALRLKQVVLLYYVYLFDKICKQLEVEYHLVAGSLLGAWRTDGFIPWDDDMDVVVYPENFMKLFDCINSSGQIDGFPEIRFDINGAFIARFGLKDVPFGIDVFTNTYADDDSVKTCRLVKRYRDICIEQAISRYGKQFNKNKLAVRAVLEELLTESVSRFNPSGNRAFVIGPLISKRNCRAFSNNIIEPLENVSFEGYNFPAPKDIDAYLSKRYGEHYWELPPDINVQHKSFKNVTYDNVKKAVNAIKDCDPQFYKKYISKEWEVYCNEHTR